MEGIIMYDRMLDKQSKPTFDDMAAYCGEGRERFIRINEWLSRVCHTTQDISFPYGNHYGWAVAHRIKKKLVCNVFAESGAFTVMIRLSNEQFRSVYDQLETETQERIDNKYPCGDGGWLHYRVTSDAFFDDVQKLLAVKCAL